MNYILMATSPGLGTQYYTGRAGEHWVSYNKDHAFHFATEEAASWKIQHFDKYKSIHDYTFTMMPVVSKVQS